MSVAVLALVIAMTVGCLLAWVLPDKPGHVDDHPALDGALGDLVRNGRIEVRR